MHPYQQTAEELMSGLGSGPEGLSEDEARSRLGRYGPNELIERRKKSPLAMFLGQFRDFMIAVLLAAAVVSGVIGEISDAIAIVVILLLNAALGFVQEYRAEKAMAALKKMAAASARVLRGGVAVAVPAAALVPGDLVLVEAGNVVPADLRVVEAARLRADEAALTGESAPVEKNAKPHPGEALSLGDRKNMLYKGTVVAYGRGAGVVTATGMATELGRIAALLEEQGEGKTPLQKRLAGFGRRISIATLIICAVVFAAGLLRGEPAVNMFLVAVSLAVAAIPEALPAVVTISLALGARKMVKQNALVRKLPSVETLGSVTYICTDKTGTLTLNRMTVEEVWVDGETIRSPESGVRSEDEERKPAGQPFLPAWNSPRSAFFTALALSNDAHQDSSGNVLGDPTEAALFAAAADHGFDRKKLEQTHPRVDELPFDSERKLMTTFHEGPPLFLSEKKEGQGAVSFTKGALEPVLDRAVSVLTAEGIRPIDRSEATRAGEIMAADGLRVMAVAARPWDALPADRSSENVEAGLVLLGLVGMLDPPRKEVKQAVAECRSAGITAVMITGDHPLTARSIAARVGILESNDPKAVITGAELDALPLEEFEKRVESLRVYARVAPAQKLKIVRALQDRGHLVAMTGDGVNDAPALKRADIGVAMNVTGTDVAKEASSLILLDDNFATIVNAVREGRTIYDNIRKVVKYLLSSNSGEIWTLFLAPFLGLPVPLQPIHILWINLMTDGLPALALSAEPGEGNVMSRPPRPPSESFFSGGLGMFTVRTGFLMGALTLSMQAWELHVGDSSWQTMVFTTLCFLQLGNVMAIRSERQSLFRQGLRSNRAMLACVVGTVALQLATIYVPALNRVFHTRPLGAGELGLVLACSSIVFLAVELEKFIKRAGKTK
jgi:P-type Ca2+ transporter type 2C